MQSSSNTLRNNWRVPPAAIVAGNPRATTTTLPVTPAPFQATTYNDIAQRTLFSRDRNRSLEIAPISITTITATHAHAPASLRSAGLAQRPRGPHERGPERAAEDGPRE